MELEAGKGLGRLGIVESIYSGIGQERWARWYLCRMLGSRCGGFGVERLENGAFFKIVVFRKASAG